VAARWPDGHPAHGGHSQTMGSMEPMDSVGTHRGHGG